MARLTALLRRIPPYVPIAFAVMAASQLITYFGTKLLLPFLTLHVLTGPLDARIPFSAPWITVYCLSYPFWIVSGLWILCSSKQYGYRFAAAFVLSMAVSAAAFLIWPGTLVRPEVTGDGFFEWWVRLIYAADEPNNLCPSLHVMITYCCFRGAMECGRVPRGGTIFAFVFLILVSCSVVLVKQHALIDIPCGILAGELGLQLSRLLRLERIGFAIEKRFSESRKE